MMTELLLILNSNNYSEFKELLGGWNLASKPIKSVKLTHYKQTLYTYVRIENTALYELLEFVNKYRVLYYRRDALNPIALDMRKGRVSSIMNYGMDMIVNEGINLI